MNKILLILVLLVSFLGASENNSTVIQAVEKVITETSIQNNVSVIMANYNIAQFFTEHIWLAFILAILIISLMYFLNTWSRIFISIITLHIVYQYSNFGINFPIIDIMYYGFAAWSLSLFIRFFHKSIIERFENQILATRINLILHIIDMLILLLTLFFIVKSFDVKNIELITTGIGVAVFFVIRKDINNLKSFLIISWDEFISIGDKIIIGDIEGRILFINKFSSIIQSENGNLVKIPNSDFLEEAVINKSKNKNNLTKEIKGKKMMVKDMMKMVKNLLFGKVKLRDYMKPWKKGKENQNP